MVVANAEPILDKSMSCWSASLANWVANEIIMLVWSAADKEPHCEVDQVRLSRSSSCILVASDRVVFLCAHRFSYWDVGTHDELTAILYELLYRAAQKIGTIFCTPYFTKC